MFDAVIFDFDGVLFDSEPLHFDACNQVFRPLGFELNWPEFQKNFIGIPDREMFPKVFDYKKRSFSPEETHRMIHSKIQCYTDMIRCRETLPMVTGAERYIKKIANENKKMAICSGSTRVEIDSALEKFNQGAFKKYFDVIVSSDEVKQGKPSPEGYLQAAAQLGVIPENCLVFEDGLHGISAAKAAGMTVIAVSTTLPASLLTQANQIIVDFVELL